MAQKRDKSDRGTARTERTRSRGVRRIQIVCGIGTYVLSCHYIYG